MKIAIISDTHFGDSQCALVEKVNGDWTVNESAFQRFCDCLKDDSGAVRDFAYLIILGDVFDLAVSSYANTLQAARPFFNRIRNLEYFPEIIVVTGNHDHVLWTDLQHEYSVVEKIRSGHPPQRNEWSLPGLIENKQGKLNLIGDFYTGTYLDNLTDNRSFFSVVTPNIYLQDKEKTMLLTHGQFLDFPWAIEGEVAKIMFGSDLNKMPLSRMQHMLGDNFALNQFICSGTGQGEVNLTGIIQELEHDVKKGDYSRIIRYIFNILKAESFKNDVVFAFWILINYCFIHHLFSDDSRKRFDDFKRALHAAMEKEQAANRIADDQVTKIKEFTGHFDLYIDNAIAGENDRIMDFYYACLEDWSRHFEKKIESIDYMIFGHTHKPVFWSGSQINWNNLDKSEVPNTGSWLLRDRKGKKMFAGANVFVYDSASMAVTCKSVPAGEILNS